MTKLLLSAQAKTAPGTSIQAYDGSVWVNPEVISVAAQIRSFRGQSPKAASILIAAGSPGFSTYPLVCEISLALREIHESPVLVVDISKTAVGSSAPEPSNVGFSLPSDAPFSICRPPNGNASSSSLVFVRLKMTDSNPASLISGPV